MANQRPDDYADKRCSQTTSGQSVAGHGVPEHEPQENACISLGRGFVPGSAVGLWIGRGARDVGRQLSCRLLFLVVHSVGCLYALWLLSSGSELQWQIPGADLR